MTKEKQKEEESKNRFDQAQKQQHKTGRTARGRRQRLVERRGAVPESDAGGRVAQDPVASTSQVCIARERGARQQGGCIEDGWRDPEGGRPGRGDMLLKLWGGSS